MKILKTAAITATLSVLFSCSLFEDFAMPKQVDITGFPSLELALGHSRAELSEHMSASKLQDMIGDNGGSDTKIAVYDYYDNTENIQKYLLNYTVTEIPLDISQYLENLDQLDLASGANSFSQDINVPEVNIPAINQTYAFDFNSLIQEKFQAGVSVTLPESPVEIEPDPFDVVFTITKPDFNYIEFKEGSLELSFSVDEGSTPTSTYEVQLKAVLYKEDGTTEIASSGDAYVSVITGSTAGNKLVIPLADGTQIQQAMKIRFQAKVGGGTALQTDTYKASVAFGSGTKINKITGVTFAAADLASEAIEVNGETLDTSSIQTYLKSAKIAAGEMNYHIKVPDSWSGITVNPAIDISGGVEISDSDFKNVTADPGYIAKKRANLAGKQIFENTEKNVIVNGSVPFGVSNATITVGYDDSGNVTDSIEFKADISITELADANIYIDSFVNVSQSKHISTVLGDEVTGYIKQIVFEDVGLEGSVETDLPPSNLKLVTTMNSAFFNISGESSETDFSGTSPYQISMMKEYADDAEGTIAITSGSEIDFDLDVAVEGVNDGGQQLVTFSRIELGKTYSLSFNAAFAYDWKSVTLNTAAQPMSGSSELGLDLKSFMDGNLEGDFISSNIDKIQFLPGSVGGYLYLTAPEIDGLDDLSFDGTFDISYTGGGGRLLDASNCSFVTTDVNFDDIADEERTITRAKLDKYPHSADLEGDVLVDMLNNKPASETLAYSVVLGSSGGSDITINKADIDQIKTQGSVSIKATIALLVSLKLEVTDAIVVDDIFTTFGNEDSGLDSDLLGRSSADDGEDVKEFVDLVKELKLSYLLTNNTGLSITAGIQAVAEGQTTPYFDKTINISGKNATKVQELVITREDLDNIYAPANYPFIPKIYFEVAAGTLSVPRDAYLGAQAVFSAKTEGTYTIWGGDK